MAAPDRALSNCPDHLSTRNLFMKSDECLLPQPADLGTKGLVLCGPLVNWVVSCRGAHEKKFPPSKAVGTRVSAAGTPDLPNTADIISARPTRSTQSRSRKIMLRVPGRPNRTVQNYRPQLGTCTSFSSQLYVSDINQSLSPLTLPAISQDGKLFLCKCSQSAHCANSNSGRRKEDPVSNCAAPSAAVFQL